MFILFFLSFLVVAAIKIFSGQFADAGILLGLCSVILMFAMWAAKEKKARPSIRRSTLATW
jgi:hypothetical protein